MTSRKTALVALEAGSVLTDRASEPHTIEVTADFSSPVCPTTLAHGLSIAAKRHPMAAVRIDRPLFPRSLRWTFIAGEGIRVEEMAGRSVGELAGFAPSLDSGPPFRAFVGPSGLGTRLVLVVNHAAFDGIGAIRFLRTALEAAGGHEFTASSIDEIAARHVTDPSIRRHFTQKPETARRCLSPSRVRYSGGRRGAPGFLVLHRVASLRKEASGTVNDRLLAGFHRTLARWIDRPDSVKATIVTMVPVNMRPAEWGADVVGNHAWLASVVTEPFERRTTESLLAVVASQMSAAKQSPSTPIASSLLGAGSLPPGIARAAFMVASRAGRSHVATALASNVGEAAQLPSVDGAQVDHLWFGPSCREPRPVSLGAVGYRGVLHLSFRFRRSTFDEAHAACFADQYLVDLVG